MAPLLANADASDPTAMNLQIVLICLAIIVVAGILAFIPVGLARARSHRGVESLTAAAILWGLVTAGTVAYATIERINYSKQYTRDIESGYFDPADTSGAPESRWMLWAGLAVGYCGLLAGSLYLRGRAVQPAASQRAASDARGFPVVPSKAEADPTSEGSIE